MSTKFEKVPPYVAATPAEVAAARAELARRVAADASWSLQSSFRRAALAAKFASALPLTAMEYVEWGSAVPVGYESRFEVIAAQSALPRQMAAEARAKWQTQEAERKAREAAQPRGPQSLREAQAQWPHGGAAFNAWVDNHQHLFAGDFLN